MSFCICKRKSIVKTVKYATRAIGSHTPSVFEGIPEEFLSDDGQTQYIKVGGFNERQVFAGQIGGAQVVLTGAFQDDISYSGVIDIAGVRMQALDRYSKGVYNALINCAAKELKGFLPVRAWNNPSHFIPEASNTYLLRPKNGARGMGFIKLQPNGKSIEHIGSVIALNREKPADEFLQCLSNAGIVVSSEGKRDDCDLVNTILQGYDVVEFIPKVISEYRVMTDFAGKPDLIIERTRTESAAGFLQARGCGQNMEKAVTFRDWSESSDVKAALVTFFTRIQRPVSSFDMFVTESGQWGFFEACSEFGNTSLPNGWVTRQARNLIQHLANYSF